MKISKKLKPSPIEKLKSKFPDHPLLLTCEQTFRHYMASMELFDFTAEDLFVEVADVLDTIFCEPTSAPKYLQGLWDDLKIKMKQNARSASPQKDLDMVCGVLFYVVAATLSLHWREYYNKELVSQLRDIVERKGLFSNKDEQEQIISNLCSHAEGLDKWINQYDESDVWLSDEIKNCLSSCNKPKNPPKGGPRTKNGNKDLIKTSFNYKPMGLETWERNFRLDAVFNDMQKEGAELIPINTNKKDFLEIFSGDDTQKRIAWIGNANELHYILSEWVGRGYLPKPKRGLWVVAAARFYHRKKDGNMWIDENFTPEQLRKAGNPENPSEDLELIIEMLKPDIRTRR